MPEPLDLFRRLSRHHVESAIAALEKGGTTEFDDSKIYDLLHNENRFPPKAVLGMACELAFGTRLRSADFSGGLNSACFRTLMALRFDIVLKPHLDGQNSGIAVITENDESQWKDETGVRYHFPARYRQILVPGTPVIYYKGKQRDAKFTSTRATSAPHYFATAFIGEVTRDDTKLSRLGELRHANSSSLIWAGSAQYNPA